MFVAAELARLYINHFLHPQHPILHLLTIASQGLHLVIGVLEAPPMLLHRVVQALFGIHLFALPDGGPRRVELRVERSIDHAGFEGDVARAGVRFRLRKVSLARLFSRKSLRFLLLLLTEHLELGRCHDCVARLAKHVQLDLCQDGFVVQCDETLYLEHLVVSSEALQRNP